ncbi:hypothetical protein UFOVP1290_440 [uncultured Caudovirales phage]|uniref:Uncharacterized protein n=1 Tax=uncultured Caudovirales phage TaxID=2100421 RepID=A0A6J5RHG4_9CAUD|nr:hypothetical protein UFOVP1290_440 [uncultured Caudovirales phage]
MVNGLQIDNAGDKRYYKNSKLHRIGSPAIELASGTKIWYLNGKRHREDGPAIEFASGIKFWYYEDKRIFCNSQEEFKRLLKLKAFW